MKRQIVRLQALQSATENTIIRFGRRIDGIDPEFLTRILKENIDFSVRMGRIEHILSLQSKEKVKSDNEKKIIDSLQLIMEICKIK